MGPSGQAVETGARVRRGDVRAGRSSWSVAAADFRGADIEAIGVVLALEAAAAIIAVIHRLAISIGNRTGHNRGPNNTGGDAPTTATRLGFAGRMVRLVASVNTARAAAILDLVIMTVSLRDFVEADMAFMPIGRGWGRKGSKAIAPPR